MSNELVPVIESEMAESLAKRYGLKAEAFVSTMRSVAMPKGHTVGELLSCLIVAAEHGLNPLTKEIYFMRGKAGIQPIVSVDGWIKKCNEHPQFDGMEFESIRDGDGKLTAMRCRIYRKDRTRPIEVEEDFAECSAGGGPVWKTHPNRMMRNRTLCQAARIAFGMAGIMEPEEFRQWQENPDLVEAAPVDITPPREGGPYEFKSESIKRPSRQTAMDAGLQEKHAELLSTLEGGIGLDDVHRCYDAFVVDGCPWGAFPRGWAVMLHEAYRFALQDATNLPEPTSEAEDADVYEAFEYEIDAALEIEDGQSCMDAIMKIERRYKDTVPQDRRNEMWDLIESARDTANSRIGTLL